jgi:hypothetical protein
MIKRMGLLRAGILFLVCTLFSSAGFAAPWINMGVKDDFAFDQPGVDFEVFQQLPNNAKGASLGPSEGDGFFFVTNRFILDTGASSIIAMNDAEDELRSNGYVTEGTVTEEGVSGSQEIHVSAPYYLEARYDNGFVNPLPNSRIMSDQFPDLVGINGIVGMPGMVGRVVTLDTTAWANVQDIFDIEPMKVNMANSLPASNGHRYSVPVTAKSFPVEGSPLPTSAPIPMLQMGVGADNLNTNGNFILDTGAAISFISTRMGRAIGLDSNHDGQLGSGDERFSDTIPIGGIGGTVEAPLFAIDRFIVPTDQGVDLVWNLDQSLTVAIVDLDHPESDVNGDHVVDAADYVMLRKDGSSEDYETWRSEFNRPDRIDGVLGADLLTSGYLTITEEGEFESTTGPIQQSHFDFRQFAQDGDTGKIYFDLTPSFDVVQPDGGPAASLFAGVPEPTGLLLMVMGSCGLALGRRRPLNRSAQS